ncbi:DnaJ-domain-containing protein [Pluteus cervinus]|uniref:DnaJ-domain-containing protein n=1 Tax=Pluteus cervinus TaxID=181527 RepID=A0ACD3BA90_9AGAR|nr:DnaJ-domain-containing protein [Pluteus cervinus]
MASDLYEALSIPKDASSEQIRKAYRKKALETHPDRLPPGSNADDKAVAEERFRKINNAYEVLNDTKTRNLYDLHGVWPPPEATRPEPSPGPQHAHSHHHHFGFHHHHMPRTYNVFQNHDPFSFAFTDPFVLFDSIFGDFGGHVHINSHQRGFPMAHGGIFQGISRMQAELDSLMSSVEEIPYSHGRAHPQQRSSKPRFVQSYSSTSFVNGRMETIEHKIDTEGNQHTRRVHQDGRETYTINGVEQTQHGSRSSYLSGPRAVTAPQRSYRVEAMTPPPPYPTSSRSYVQPVPVIPPHGREHERVHSPRQPYATHSDPASHHGRYESRSQRRRPYDYY